MDDLSILIKAIFDPNSKKQILDEIDSIEKYLNQTPLKFKIDVDSAEFKQFSANIQKITNNINKNIKISPYKDKGLDEFTQKYTRATGEAYKLSQETSKFKNELCQTVKLVSDLDKETGQVIKDTQTITDNYKKQNEQIKKINAEQSKYWSQRVKETMSSMTQKPDELIKMADYYKKLENAEQQRLKTNRELQTWIQHGIEQEIKRHKELMDTIHKKALEENRIYNDKKKQLEENIKLMQKANQMGKEQVINSQNRQIEEYKKTSIELKKLQENALTTNTILKNFGGERHHKKADELTASLQKLNVSQDMTQKEIKETITQAKLLSNQLNNVSKEARSTGNNSMTMGKMITTAFEKFSVWIGVTALFFGTIRAIKQAVTEVIELSNATLELNKVLDVSSKELVDYTEKSYEMAKSLGRSGKDVLQATSEFARAGWNLEESSKLAEQALLLTNIADGLEDTSEAAGYLIAVLKGYNLTAQDTVHVVNLLNEVSNNYAVNTVKLAEGLQRTSGTLSQTGTSMEELTGILTGGYEVLRNMEKVSSGLITISSRLQGVNESGEEIDGLMPKLQKAFKEFAGIDIQTTNGELRSTFDILKDLSTVWSTLNDEQRQKIGELSSGIRQAPVLNAILLNWENVEGAAKSALESNGSAIEENEKVLESLQGKINLLNSALSKLAYDTINSGSLGSVIDIAKKLVEVIDAVVKQFGLVQPVVAIASTAFFMFSKNGLKSFYDGFGSVFDKLDIFNKKVSSVPVSIGKFNNSLKGMSASSVVASAKVKGLSVAVSALNSTFAILGTVTKFVFPILAFTALSYVISKVSAKLFENSTALATNAEENINYIKSTSNNISQVDALISKLEDSNTSLEEQHEIQAKLAEIIPEATTGYNEQGQAIAENIDLVKQLNAEKLKELKDNAIITIGKYNIDDELEKYKKLIDERNKIKQNIETLLNSGDTTRIDMVLPRLTEQLKKVNSEITNSEKAFNEYNQAVQISNAYSGTNFKLVKNKKELLEMFDAIEQGNKDLFDLKEGFVEYTEVIKQNREELVNLENETGELTDVLEKLNSGYSFSKEEIEKLKKKYPELASAMSKEKDQCEINKKAIIKLRDAKVNSLKTMLNAENNAVIIQGQKLKQRLKNIGIEIEGIETLDEARKASDELARQDMLKAAQKYGLGATTEIAKAAMPYIHDVPGQIYDYANALNYIKELEDTISSGGTGGGNGSSSKSGGSSSTSSQTLTESDPLLSFKNAIDKTNNSIQENDKLLSSSNLTYQKRIELLSEQIKLYKQQQSNVHNLAQGYREERNQITKILDSKGFKFTGSGDNLTITNLNHLKGQTKEVEEVFNKFFDIQLNLIPQLQQQWLDLTSSIDTSIFEKINTQLNIYVDLQEDLDRELSIINSKKSLYNEDSEEYLALISHEIALIKEKQNQTHLEAEYIREQLKLEELSIDKKIELNKRLRELGASWWDYESQIRAVNEALKENIISTNSSIANDIISAIKKGYQKMLDLEKATVEEKVDLAQEEHDKKIKMLDDWLSHHNDVIDEMLKDLDKLYATEDYEEQLEELTNKRAEIEQKLQIALNLSDTAVDKDLRVQQAQEELNEVTKEIEELMRNRARNLRKEELQETKEQNQKIVDDKKKSENNKLDAIKETAEEEIAIIEEKYDRLINNDEMYEQIREEIMKGTYTRANKHITTILNNLQKYNYNTISNMKQSWQDLENAIYQATKAKESFMNIQDPDNIILPHPPNLDLGNEGIEDHPGQHEKNDERLKRDREYLISQVKRTRKIIENRKLEKLPIDIQLKYLEKLRGMGLQYHGINIDQYHKGGIVGKSSNKIIDLVNKLFNTKPDEIIVKSLVGELQVPPKNIFSNFIPNMQNMINNVVPQQQLATSTNSNITYNISMNIDKLNGNKDGGKTAFNELVKEVRKRGGVL